MNAPRTFLLPAFPRTRLSVVLACWAHSSQQKTQHKTTAPRSCTVCAPKPPDCMQTHAPPVTRTRPHPDSFCNKGCHTTACCNKGCRNTVCRNTACRLASRPAHDKTLTCLPCSTQVTKHSKGTRNPYAPTSCRGLLCRWPERQPLRPRFMAHSDRLPPPPNDAFTPCMSCQPPT